MIRSLLERLLGRGPRQNPEHDLVVRKLSEQERRIKDALRDSYRLGEDRLRGQR